MKNACIIGAGNIGSRHLQGLRKVKFPLSIEVVDPSKESLEIARQRYEQVESLADHKISFLSDLSKVSKEIDLAIVATNSNVRRKVTEQLLTTSSVKYLVLEKILFQNPNDYQSLEKLLKKKNCKTWINFSMRTMPFYHDLKGKVKGPIQMIVSGSQYGLITNAIHFIDYIAFITGNYDFIVDIKGLDKNPIESKRLGFLELNGTLGVHFTDGSFGSFTCYANGNAPFIIELLSPEYRCISKESERKAWLSCSDTDWKWEEADSNIPFQSDMTNKLVEDILKSGTCPLTSYKDAAKLHITFLDSLLQFLNESSDEKYSLYPFT